MNFNSVKTNGGFSLALTLIIVGALASILTGIVLNSKSINVEKEARVAGWEGAVIARAARIHARNQIELRPNLKNELSTTPEEISLAVLINNSLLPASFARASGGQYFNALNQRIRIFLANYPVGGNPALDTTVPTAYVIFVDNNRTTPDIMQDVAQSLVNEGVAVSYPIYSAGINTSAQCNGNTRISTWDSGCLDNTEYSFLTSGVAFALGSIVIPAWRSVNFDSRALLRFPQPESTGNQTMLTDLWMGEVYDCESDTTLSVDYPSDTAQASNICGAPSDDPASVSDNRRAIMNTNNVFAGTLLADPQANSDVFTNGNTGIRTFPLEEAHSLDIVNNLNAIGDAKVYDGNINVVNRVTVDRNVNVSGSSAGISASLSANTIETGNVVANNLSVNRDRTNFSKDISVRGTLDSVGNLTAGQSFVTQNLLGTGASTQNINVAGTTSLLGTTSINNLAIDGSQNQSGYSVITGNLNVNNISVSGESEIGQGLSLNNTVTTNLTEITNNGSANCTGKCPIKAGGSRDQQCQNLAAQGIENYNACLDRVR